MTIKAKLSWGLGFLFAVLTLLGGLGIFYLHRLSDETKEILKDNYESVVYAQGMIKALDEMEIEKRLSENTFEENLVNQEKNVTEVGEKEITRDVRNEFSLFKDSVPNREQSRLVRQKLRQLIDINMQAILRKNTSVEKSSKTAIAYMSIIGTVAFLVSLSFIVGFPGIVANPIRELTESIQEIANKNYKQRLNFTSNDEFGEVAKAFNTMAERLDDYENSNLAQIIFQKKRVETVINTMHDPIIGLDENGRILFANKDAISILGVQERALIGQYAPDVALTNDLLRALLTNDAGHKPLKIFFQDRESYFIKETLEIKADENLIGSAIILKNVTEFKELDSAKTNFIATISHELKTPISSIKMGLKLLEDERIGATNEAQKKLLVGIKEDSNRLLKITGELLDLTQVESGKINLLIQPTDPIEVVQFAYETVRFQAEQKQVVIEILYGPDLPKLHIDKEKTTWVLVNLLSNAIRYSIENTKVVVNVGKDTKGLVFSVQDFGTGIDPKYKDRIFEKYFKLPDGNVQGTGLGLAISKEFIEAQGGTIEVQSTLGKGTIFHVRFKSS